MQHAHVLPAGKNLAGQCEKRGVDLDAEDRPGGLGQPRRQRAGAAAYLQGQVVFAQLRRADHKIEQVQVDEEILPELVLRLDAAFLQQVPQVGKCLAR
jgi:hypothetical protein